MTRTVDWRDDRIVTIDQTLLPAELRFVELTTVDEVVDAIRRLVIRGAPAIGVAGALGVALAVRAAERDGRGDDAVRGDAARIRAARPTAVNLAWAVDRVLARLPAGRDALVAEAVAMLGEDEAACEALSRRGAAYLHALRPGAWRIHTHCNAGALATVDWGTALGVVRALHEDGLVHHVIADETRPLLQGARLTAFELERLGVPYRIAVDGAAASLIARGLVDVVIVGADRVAANGDAANKIGTYPLALAAARAGIPFVVAAPESTIDMCTATGADIHIEERDADEVLTFAGVRTAPPGAGALNPAFDVTPHDLITALVTEARVVCLAVGETLATSIGRH